MTSPCKTYRINEVYRSIQGEGARTGTSNVFVRFTGCNMRCRMEPGPKSPGGFDCDTEFASGRPFKLEELLDWIVWADRPVPGCKWVILTGGEPGLQVDDELIDAIHRIDYQIAIETNGSIKLPDGIDYIAISPKVAEHAIRQLVADEVRYVRGYGQAIPMTVVKAERYFISPAFCGDAFDEDTVQWCKKLVEENAEWTLSLQQHKLDKVR